ncbi:MAG: hypothetical protein K2O89_06990 [Clostridia bacterium]|nr:hypothetical protein [Clostridia bacterium]
MKKKLIATLVAGAVLSTGLIGLTACGGGLSINKGEEVDAEGWAKALEATAEATNYTIESYEESNVDYSGTMADVTISFSVSGTSQGKTYIDIDNNTSYQSSTGKATVKGDVPEALKDQYSNKEYKAEEYYAKVNDSIYHASYNNASSEAKWEVDYAGSVSSPVEYVLYGTYSTTEDGEEKSLDELYDAFTYSGGVYTATLYADGDAATVSISIKGGYVVGYAVEYTLEQSYGMTMKITGKSVNNFSNYGSTTVNASEDAKNAVNNYVNGN